MDSTPKAIAAICTAFAHAVASVAGPATIYDNPPDVLPAWSFPAILIYPGQGSWRIGSYDGGNGVPMREGLHTIILDLHADASNKPLEQTLAVAKPYCDTIPAALFAAYTRDTFGGSVVCLGDPEQTDGYPMRQEFLTMGWGSTETIGVRFQTDVWVEEEIR